MVVGQRLTGRSRVVRGLSGSREIGELGRGLGMLVLDVLGDRAWTAVSVFP